MRQFPDNLHANYDVCSNGGLRLYANNLSTIRRVMATIDLIVIGYGAFLAIVAFGSVALLAAHRH